jgi:hypothetical protein
MSVTRPTTLWSAWLYTRFDLGNLSLGKLAVILGMPLFVIGMIGLPVFFIDPGDSDEPDTFIVVADPNLHEKLAEWFEEDESLRVVTTRSEAEEVTSIVARLSDSFTTDGLVEFEGSWASEKRADRLDRRLDKWLVHHWMTEAGGQELLPLIVERSDGTLWHEEADEEPEPEPETEEAGFLDAKTAQLVIGFLVIGVFGMMGGLGMGTAVSKSGGEGFNSILAVGTSKRAIYFSELLTLAFISTAQAMSWMAVIAVVVAVGVDTADLQLPDLSTLIVNTPFLALLGVFAVVQSCGLGCFMHRMSEELPRQARERIGQVMSLVLITALYTLDLEIFDASVISVLSAVPFVGPLALWAHFLDGGAAVPLLFALQIGFTVASLQLGSWVFMLGEPPVSYLRRQSR